MNNVAFILQPHFNSNCFRVAVQNQQGSVDNYIAVCCSPSYNGIYQYPAVKRKQYDIWQNGNTSCYCVPLSDCNYVKSLKDVTNPIMIKSIKKLQKKWLNNQVKNRDYQYKEKPEWIL